MPHIKERKFCPLNAVPPLLCLAAFERYSAASTSSRLSTSRCLCIALLLQMSNTGMDRRPTTKQMFLTSIDKAKRGIFHPKALNEAARAQAKVERDLA
jgi:hypothetical protein